MTTFDHKSEAQEIRFMNINMQEMKNLQILQNIIIYQN